MLIQNYYIHTDARGREVIIRREPDKHGLPPAHHRVSSPYDTDARWAAKGEDLFWCGYKLHLTETCDTANDTGDGDTTGRHREKDHRERTRTSPGPLCTLNRVSPTRGDRT